MSYIRDIAEASLYKSFGSVVVNVGVTAILKGVSWGCKRVVNLSAPSFTGAALSGVATGTTVVTTVFCTRTPFVQDRLAQLGISGKTLKQVQSVIVFAMPFFVTLLSIPYVAAKYHFEASTLSAGLFSAFDLALFAHEVSWDFGIA